MSGPLAGILGIFAMLAGLFLLRIPAAFVMAMVGFVGFALLTSFSAALGMIGTEIWNLFSSYGLTVIPMFILVGEIVFYAGYNDNLYNAAHRWFGRYRGGLAVTTIIASAAFAAICGSNTATAATMGAVALPAMKKFHYHPVFNAGAVAAGATLGVVIPPSVVLIVYGLYTGQSIGKLFFGGVIPGMLLVCFMVLTVFILCRRKPGWGPRGPASSLKEKLGALPEVLDIVVLFGIIMAALFTGWVTATEAAAVSAVMATVLAFLRKKLTLKGFIDSVTDTLRISCMVFMIIVGAVIFGRFLTLTRLPFEAAEWIGSLSLPHGAVLAAILLFYIIGGCIMDALAFLLISLPIFYPLVLGMGYDPVWFGQVVTIATTLGSITPPVGICCYIIHGMAREIPLTDVFRGGLYYIPSYIVVMAILMLFPYGTVLFLAGLVR